VPELQAAVEASGITKGWIKATNHKLKLIEDEKANEDIENKKATAFIQEVYTRVTFIIKKILNGNNNNKLHMEILDTNNIIAS